jgi:Ulp1 protease family, C-terminal catalytic domain
MKNVAAEQIFRKVVPNKVTECSLANARGEICIRDKALEEISKVHGIGLTDPAQILVEAKKKTGCVTQKCVLEKTLQVSRNSAPETAKSFHVDVKRHGPTDSHFLSNSHVDNILQQWQALVEGFFAYNFNMLNYAKYSWRNNAVNNNPDTLATVNLTDLVGSKGFTTAGCIINSDVYQGPGKHWMSLVVDARGPKRWTVEFFNSSGNSPAPEWVNWLVKSRGQLEEISKGIPVEIVNVIGLRQQYSKSECGVYSLFYIWGRLRGVPPEVFLKTHIPDRYMFEFRQHLYADRADRLPEAEFNWDDYQKKTRIEWEERHHDR